MQTPAVKMSNGSEDAYANENQTINEGKEKGEVVRVGCLSTTRSVERGTAQGFLLVW